MTARMRPLVISLMMLALAEICEASDYCGDAVYNDTVGSIHSPGFPSRSYLPLINCTYAIQASKPSRISLTFQLLDIEFHDNCSFDWVEVHCVSHHMELPLRFCGQEPLNDTMIFEPCTRMLIAFNSDSSINGAGFSIDYEVTEMECAENCTPVAVSYGYDCPCDANQTNASSPTTRPWHTCPSLCKLSRDHTVCNCPRSSRRTSTLTTCPPGCHEAQDFFGYASCNCEDSTTPATIDCDLGCYRSTDWLGYPFCNCPSSTNRPLSCSYGCYSDTDYWGNPFCNCPASTQPPIWCSSGCTSATDVYGNTYCNCPTTTLPPCFSPCYYSWDYTYDYTGRRYCYCPTTTTNPPATGCNQTLTGTFGTVTSPNYPNMYTKGIDCLQTILVPMATSIRLRLIDMNVYYYDSNACSYEYIEITGCDGSYNVYCNTYNFPAAGLDFPCTESSRVTINFHSSTTSYYSYRGFKLTYTANFGSNCTDSGLYLSDGGTGLITSPNFPNNFPSYSECYNYIFTDDDNVMIKITFEQLRLEESSKCVKVSLMLTCQDDTRYSQEVCGMQIPAPMTFDCRVLQIWFKSNSTNPTTPRAYKIRYYGISKRQTTLTDPNLPAPRGANAGENDLPQSAKLGIGLGIGIGGFFLIILIVILIIIIVSSHRQVARRERRHLDDLAIICRNINGRTSDAGGNVRFWTGSPHNEGFVNPMHATHSVEHLPGYQSAAESHAESSSVGGYSIDKPKSQLMD